MGKIKDPILCYTKCKPGYSGIATLCYEDCPGGYKDSGDPGTICSRHILDWFTKKSYGRGVGRPAKCCPKGEEYIAGLCYSVTKMFMVKASNLHIQARTLKIAPMHAPSDQA